MIRNPDIRCLLVLLGLSGALWSVRLAGPIDLRYDAGVYYTLGRSLAEGRGYRLLNEPGAIEAIQYPPLLPAIVAFHQRILGISSPAVVAQSLRLSYCFITTLYILSVYGMARQYLDATPALLVALIAALSLNTTLLSDLLFAEIPFALVTALFVICNRRSEEPRYFILTSLLGMAAYGLRTAGVALLAAWVTESLLRRSWKQLTARVAVLLLPIVAWQSYVSRVTSSVEYRHPVYAYQRASYQYYNVSYAENMLLVEPFVPELGRASLRDLAVRFFFNLAAMPRSFGEGVTANPGFWMGLFRKVHRRLGIAPPSLWVSSIPLTAVGCLVVAGAGVLLTRREWLIPLYLAASLALICLTPWPGQFTRYLTPLTPFLALSLVELFVVSRAYCLRLWPVNGRRVALIGLVLVVATVLGIESFAILYSYKRRHEDVRSSIEGRPGRDNWLFYYDRQWAAFDDSLAWLSQHARSSDIVATSSPHWVYLHTGLKAVLPPMEADLAKAQQLLDSVPVTYTIVDELDFLDVTRRYTRRTIAKYPELWQLVHHAPGGKTCVYRRVSKGRRGPEETETTSVPGGAEGPQ